uniref:Uncharacterized protein n=1 Tax=Rhizophora mucronata TaxID=61149 RepID=A0A2P2P2R5_RHIMU
MVSVGLKYFIFQVIRKKYIFSWATMLFLWMEEMLYYACFPVKMEEQGLPPRCGTIQIIFSSLT